MRGGWRWRSRPCWRCGALGQNGLLLASVWILAALAYPRRRLVAGLLFGLLSVKPHLALLIPLALLAGRDWRALTGFALAALGVHGLALALFGWGALHGFLAMLPLFGALAANGLTGWDKMGSVYAALRLAGAAPAIAWTAHGAIAALAIGVTLRAWRRGADPALRVALLAAATLLVSPYLYVYDQLVLIVPIAWLVRAGVGERTLALLYALPLASILLLLLPGHALNPAPLLPAILLVMLWRHAGARIGKRQICT